MKLVHVGKKVLLKYHVHWTHIQNYLVLVKFKPEVTEEIKQQAIKDVLALKDSIPQITSATAGKNFTDRGKGFEYGKRVI